MSLKAESRYITKNMGLGTLKIKRLLPRLFKSPWDHQPGTSTTKPITNKVLQNIEYFLNSDLLFLSKAHLFASEAGCSHVSISHTPSQQTWFSIIVHKRFPHKNKKERLPSYQSWIFRVSPFIFHLPPFTVTLKIQCCERTRNSVIAVVVLCTILIICIYVQIWFEGWGYHYPILENHKIVCSFKLNTIILFQKESCVVLYNVYYFYLQWNLIDINLSSTNSNMSFPLVLWQCIHICEMTGTASAYTIYYKTKVINPLE